MHTGKVLHMHLLNLPLLGYLAFLVEMRHQVLGVPSLPCATLGGKADLAGGQKATVALLPATVEGQRMRIGQRACFVLRASCRALLVAGPSDVMYYICLCLFSFINFIISINICF